METMEKVDSIIYFFDLVNEGTDGDDLKEIFEIGQKFPSIKSVAIGPGSSFFMVYEGEATEQEMEDLLEGKEVGEILEMIEEKVASIFP